MTSGASRTRLAVRAGILEAPASSDADAGAELVVEGPARTIARLLAGDLGLAALAAVRARTPGGRWFPLPPGDVAHFLGSLHLPPVRDANLVLEATVAATPVGDISYWVEFADGVPHRWGEGAHPSADVRAALPYEAHLLWAMRRRTILEACWGPGSTLEGDLPELMLVGGLYARPDFVAGMCRLPAEAFEPLRRFRDLVVGARCAP